MRRALRWLFHAFSALSLKLCWAVAASWLMSADLTSHEVECAGQRVHGIYSYHGAVHFAVAWGRGSLNHDDGERDLQRSESSASRASPDQNGEGNGTQGQTV